MKRLILGTLSLITAAFLLLVCIISASAVSYLKGDADGDGEVSAVDATVIQRVLADIYTDADGSIAKRGEVTGDTLTLLDATEIQRYLADFENIYHIGEVCDTEPTVSPTTGLDFPTEDNQLPIITN